MHENRTLIRDDNLTEMRNFPDALHRPHRHRPTWFWRLGYYPRAWIQI